MSKRDMKIIADCKAKTVTTIIDGEVKWTDTYNWAEHAITAAHAIAEQYAHHMPVVTIDLRGACS